MEFNQFRIEPLPPKNKSIWAITVFAAISILILAILCFGFLNPDVVCQVTGGKWLDYYESQGQRLPQGGFIDAEAISEDEVVFFGMCIR